MANVAVKRVGAVRRTTLNGRSYLVAPMTMIVPGVLSGSKGSLYYPPDEVGREVGAWNGMPLVLNHPTDAQGNNVTARSPETLDRVGVGHVFHARFVKNGKGKPTLRAQAWFDEELLKNKAPDVYAQVNNGKPVELSTGLYTDNYKAKPGATHNGRGYDYVAKNYRPDHLAILPGERGACSNVDGCGVNVVANSNPEGINQYTSGQAHDLTTKAHAIGRSDASKEEKGKAHAKAAEAHRQQIFKSSKEVSQMARGRHADLAKKHEQLAKHYGVTANALPNQPRSKNTGKLKKMNAGTGKGPLHQTAQDGFHGGPQKQTCENCTEGECTCDPTRNSSGDDAMKLSDKQRKDVVSFLTTNCECWKGETETLNEFTDDKLVALKKDREEAMENEAVANAARETLTELGADEDSLTATAMPQFIKDKMKAKAKEDAADGGADDDEEDDSGKKVKNKKATTNKDTTVNKPKNVDEWLSQSDAPDEVKEIVGNARQLVEDQKKALVARLVANVKDAKLKERLVTNHMAKKLNQLRDEVAALPAPARRQIDDDLNHLRAPDYSGAGGGYTGNAGADDNDDLVTEEDLTPPTLNYSELAGSKADKKRKTA